jgi:hypothetical protein
MNATNTQETENKAEHQWEVIYSGNKQNPSNIKGFFQYNTKYNQTLY